MTTRKYCAFLRGVNVNGRKMIMRDVCEIFGCAGMSEVNSILNTGNILFQSAKPLSELSEILQKALSARYGAPVYLFVKTAAEVRALLQNCPYVPDEDLHTYVFVCQPGFEAQLLTAFQAIKPTVREEAAAVNGVFYWRVAKGLTLDAGFSDTLARRDWQSAFTSRNLNTIARVDAKLNPPMD